MRTRHLLSGVLIMAINLAAMAAPVLLEHSFRDGTDGWEGTGTAQRSDIGRRPGTGSIKLSQWDDAEQDAQWLSPPVKSPGGPVVVSFWAADNYLRSDDFSYSASMDIATCDADGNISRTTMNLQLLTWDDTRRQDIFWGQLLPTGLVWRYYEFTHQPAGEWFRLSLNWPKGIIRGDVYVTDVRVAAGTAATPTTAAGPAADAPESTLALELSTVVGANLFMTGVPLRFEALLYATDGEPLPAADDLTLHWDVSDFDHFAIAAGTAPFAAAQPLADESFYRSPAGRRRAVNLHTHVVLPEAAAVPGRLLFLRAVLKRGDEALAEDTVSYGVLTPHRLDPEDYLAGRFSSSYNNTFWTINDPAFADDSVGGKMGIAWTQTWDYHWVRRQPEYPGPFVDFGERLNAPRLNYIPNLEQIRGRPDDHPWGSVLTMSPKGATLPDPLRPGRTTFDIDAYVAYIVAYTRHHREYIGRVAPSGLERTIDARTIELHKKAYTALKAEFPDLPVGLMLYGLFSNPSTDVDIFFEHELYNYADFINTHFYASTADWTEWNRLQRTLEQMGRARLPLISTEFAVVGGPDQVERARNMIVGCLDAFANGMEQIYYFNVTNGSALPAPFGRAPTDLGGAQESGFLYLQRVDRPRVSPLIEVADAGRRWAGGSHSIEHPGQSLMPTLSTMTHAHLIREFDRTEHRRSWRPTPDIIAHHFDRADATVAALWLASPLGFKTVAIRTGVPFLARDLFGRETRLEPQNGVALLSLDSNPLTLIFDQPLDELVVDAVGGGLTAMRLPKGGAGEFEVNVPPVFGEGGNLRLESTVDGTWPDMPQMNMALTGGAGITLKMTFNLPPEKPVGAYPFTTHLYVNGQLAGLLRTSLTIEDLLQVAVDGVPVFPDRDPAIAVTVASRRQEPSRGVIRFVDRWFSPDFTPRVHEQAYEAPPEGTATVHFPVSRELISLAPPYEVEIELRDESGITIVKREEVSFRATRRAPAPITVDGDLSDWPLDRLVPIPFERQFTSWGKPYGGPEDISGHFYTMWDDDHLYFAAVIIDDVPIIRANNVGIWQDDNILIGLYPWGWRLGEPTNSGYYREHLGLCADGEARVFRIGNVPGGQVTSEGIPIAVRREADRFIYEWAYPQATVTPLALEEGGRFRLSLEALDRDEIPEPGTRSALGGLQFGGLNLNVLAQPIRWREFLLTD